ncbi:hypothetical protein BaRGS_00027133 [Batillaria attramentaria]|uniref:Uncharacterized protein n=1 Tax=Batillaria attramentaria TaxID=370345 RepID=A0ABD0K3D9_9CAEN
MTSEEECGVKRNVESSLALVCTLQKQQGHAASKGSSVIKSRTNFLQSATNPHKRNTADFMSALLVFLPGAMLLPCWILTNEYTVIIMGMNSNLTFAKDLQQNGYRNTM